MTRLTNQLIKDLAKIAGEARNLECMKYQYGQCTDFPGAMGHVYCPACEIKSSILMSEDKLAEIRKDYGRYLKRRHEYQQWKRRERREKVTSK
jgi:hypothetical protein